MANQVYETAVKGLGSLVSPRAATRMIDSALRATGRTSDDVSASAMRKLLLGKVRRELEGVLPSAGLSPGLKRIVAELAPRKPTGSRPRSPSVTKTAQKTTSSTAATRTGSRSRERSRARSRGRARQSEGQILAPHEVKAVSRSSVYLPGLDIPEDLRPMDQDPGDQLVAADVLLLDGAEPELVWGDAASHATTSGTAAPSGNTVPSRAQAGPPGAGALIPSPVGTRGQPAAKRELSERVIDLALRSFSDLETVRQIVVVRANEVVQARGMGLDASRLPTLATSIRLLLKRQGKLKSFSLEHSAGVLFLFPIGDGTIMVLAQPNVNIGAVLAARATLEEAA